MASGKQIAEQSFQIFQAWLAGKTDADFRQMVSRGVLSRTEIAKECGFGKSALDQKLASRQHSRLLKTLCESVASCQHSKRNCRLMVLLHPCAKLGRSAPRVMPNA